MAGEYNLSVILSAQNKASSVLSGFASELGAFGPAAVGAAAVLGVVGVTFAASAKKAADYQTALTSLVTGAGESQKNLASVGQGILQMSVQTATGTKQLTDGMYMIESAGYHGADGLNVLKAAAQGAKVGNADLGVTANALTTILTDYHLKSTQATGAMNALVTTVASGKTHMQDLAKSMGTVLPLSSALGVSFPQVAGALATMTNSGMSAQHAAQSLANTMRSMAAPNSVAVKSMQSVGLSAQQLKDTMSSQGLTGAIQLVEQHVGKTFPAGSVQAVTAFKNIMGGATGYTTALMLGGKNMSSFEADVKNIGKSMGQTSGSVQGFAAVQGTFNFQMDAAKQAVNAAMISLGEKLLPVLTKVMSAVTPLITSFANWVSTLHANSPAVAIFGGVLAGLAAIVLAVVVPAMWAWAVATIAATWPILLAGVIIAAVVAGIILVIQNWGAISQWFQNLWQGICSAVGGFFSALGTKLRDIATGIKNGVGSAFSALGTNVHNKVTDLKNGVGQKFSDMGTNVHNAVTTLGTNVVKGFEWMYNHNYYFKALVDDVVKLAHNLQIWLEQTWETIKSKVTEVWTTIKDFVEVRWNYIYALAEKIWFEVTSTIQKAVNTVKDWLQNIWTTITTWLSDQWNKFSGLARTAWQAVSGVFSSIWNTYISGPLTSLWNSISGWFGNLATQALQWGQNVIQGFINGIKNMLGAVGNAASSVVNTVKNFLGFHSPAKEGPGSDADTWAPNLMKMYEKGILGGLPGIKIAVAKAAELMKAGFIGDANSLDQKINLAQQQLNLDAKHKAEAKYRANELKHYEKYLEERNKAYERYEKEKHHKKAFAFHAFHALAEPKSLDQQKALVLGMFPNLTRLLNPTMGNGALMSTSSLGSTQQSQHVTNINLIVHGDVVDHKKLLDELEKLQAKHHRMQGTHTVVTSGGRAK